MDYTIFKTACENLYHSLTRHGYLKEANELLAFSPTIAPENSNNNRFVEERPPQNAEQKPFPAKSIYKGQPGSAAPVIELGRILDRVEQSPSFKNLPKDVMEGILNINKMTANAFKYASEKEAFFGGERNPLKDLKNLLVKFDKTGPDPRKVPEEVTKAVDNLNFVVDKALESQPKEKTLLEKSRDVARSVAEKGKDVARGVGEKGQGILEKGKDVARGVAEKGKDIARGIEEKGKQKDIERFETDSRQQSAFGALKKSLSNYKIYRDIFYRLPPKVIKALEGIGLGLDDLGNATSAKVASHINRTLLQYLKTKEAYSKKEMGLGKKEEVEHMDIYDTFAQVFKRKNIKVPMTKEQFVVSVAKAHLKEDPHYYTKLKKTFSKKAMDFSGIGNLMTPEGKLDERELSRVIRLAIAAELDAVHLYELIVDSSDNSIIKKVLQDIADEEKVHASELNELLSHFDSDNNKFIEDGKKEVKDLIK